jgi:hypothetical protein
MGRAAGRSGEAIERRATSIDEFQGTLGGRARLRGLDFRIGVHRGDERRGPGEARFGRGAGVGWTLLSDTLSYSQLLEAD